MTLAELNLEYAMQDESQRREAIAAMLQHPATRKFLWWLLGEGKAIGHNPFSTDPLTMARECGEMAIGQTVMREVIETSASGFIALMKEMDDERRDRTAALRNAAAAGDPFDSGRPAGTGAERDRALRGERNNG